MRFDKISDMPSRKKPYNQSPKKGAGAYAEEAKERWGHTDAYRQSQERVGKMSPEDMRRTKETGDLLLREIVLHMEKGAESPDVQALIARHHDNLRAFYEPTIEMYRGLGTMYVDDVRFAKYFAKYHEDLPAFMRDAMHVYCDTNESEPKI